MPEPQLIEPAQQFLTYIRDRARALRNKDTPPQSLPDWTQRKQQLRQRLLAAWGGFPAEPCDLAPRKLGELPREGYRIEKVVFQTRPGVLMTANAYVPAGDGKHPAVLVVHGHWRGAKQDPVVQSRCLGLVKLGFFVLCVDAFGAGERGIGKALGEYHGEMTASTLWPVGLPLSGLQVYENMRAVDYLQTRPEVDGGKLGITGASGGGNQTMYAGAFDERFGCVVPVCSVGNYQAYLGPACCMCEVVPGALTFTEEWGLLAMVAPRALMVISATKDSIQFSVGEAQKSVAEAQRVFRLFGKAGLIEHALFESPHAYNQQMREAMYGWMTLHLKGQGLGSPIPEPALTVEDPEALRCFPGDSRPDDFVTLPRFAAAEGRRILERLGREKIQHREHWEATAERLQHALAKNVLGGWPARRDLVVSTGEADDAGNRLFRVETEPGVEIAARHQPGTAKGKSRRLAIVCDLDGLDHAIQSPTVQALAAAGWELLAVDLRATGRFAVAGDAIGRAPDHNSAEWSMWTGRPLLGQWVWDIRRVLDLVSDRMPELLAQAALVGLGPAGLPALCAAIVDRRVQRVSLVGTLASYVSDVPYTEQRMGTLAPGVLRDVGDVAHLAALVAPRQVIVAGGVNAAGQPLEHDALKRHYEFATGVYALLDAKQNLSVLPTGRTEEIVAGL